MGILAWLSRSVGRELDQKVFGAEGVAQGRFALPIDQGELLVQAWLGNDHRGAIELRAHPRRDTNDNGGVAHERRESGGTQLAVELGKGKRYRETGLTVDAEVTRASVGVADLAVLTVEVAQRDPDDPAGPPLARETFSVESRFDPAGHARLGVHLQIV